MAHTPHRLELAMIYRKYTEKLGSYFPDLKVNPSLISLFGIFSLIPAIIYIRNFPYNIIFIILSWIFDYFDGIYARKQGIAGFNGYMVDITLDHMANMLLFISIIDSLTGKILLFLSILNIQSTLIFFKREIHLVLPLRFIFIIILAIQGLN